MLGVVAVIVTIPPAWNAAGPTALLVRLPFRTWSMSSTCESTITSSSGNFLLARYGMHLSLRQHVQVGVVCARPSPG
jgi:hypothetical protein